MTIDPSVLDNYRRRAKGHSVEPEHSIMLNLLDALEEALEALRKVRDKTEPRRDMVDVAVGMCAGANRIATDALAELDGKAAS